MIFLTHSLILSVVIGLAGDEPVERKELLLSLCSVWSVVAEKELLLSLCSVWSVVAEKDTGYKSTLSLYISDTLAEI